MKKRMTKIFACFTAVMLMASGMPDGFMQKSETFQKEHTAYAAVTGYITSYEDLVEAAATGGVYVLSNSIVLTEKIIVPKGVDLTLLQEQGEKNKITSVKLYSGFLYVEEGASLTLGSTDTEAIVVDGSNLDKGISLLVVKGTLTIENADLSCPNEAYAVWVDGKIYMNGGCIHDSICGICLYGEAEGVISGGTISDSEGSGIIVYSNASCKMKDGIISNVSCGISCGGSFTMTGGLVAGCDIGAKISGSNAAFTMNGGVVSNSKTYALYHKEGTIYLRGGNIRNGRCITCSKGSFYIGGSPYLDDNSFILVCENAPVIQMEDLAAPAANPNAKINIYGMTTKQPLVTALSEDSSLLASLALYQSYDRDFSLAVKENQIYLEGTKEIDSKVYPTVRPGLSDIIEQPSPSAAMETKAPVVTKTPLPSFTPQTATTPVATSGGTVQSSAPQSTMVSTEVPEAPVQSIEPQTTITAIGTLGTPAATQQASVPFQDGKSTLEPVATSNVYGEFSSTRPQITQISAKGLEFQLKWKFSSVVSANEYDIFYSTDQKKYSLIKTVDATVNNTSVSVSKAYNGKKIYFYVVAKRTDAVSGNVYQSEKSYVASKYLIDKVTGTTGSYYTDKQKLIVKWKKVSNCTGYSVYIKAYCNGKTLTKRCATVSKTKNSVSISTRKIKRKFSSNGKPVRIKKYSVRAFYKKGKKTAYSPN